jgi:type III restriction enzyme
MDHFSRLPDGLWHELEKAPAGDPVPSLANVFRLRRPMVIVDEAHNARTALSFEVLARLAPALIVEFTATPVTPDKADAANSAIPSNVLHQVSAAELNADEMIKLPLVLRGGPDPNDTIADAIGWRDEPSKKRLRLANLSGRSCCFRRSESRRRKKPSTRKR